MVVLVPAPYSSDSSFGYNGYIDYDDEEEFRAGLKGYQTGDERKKELTDYLFKSS